MSICFFNRAEGVATEVAVHIQGSDEAVEGDFPLGSVKSLSVDDSRYHNLVPYGFILISDTKLVIKP